MARWGLRHRFELTRLELIGVVASAGTALFVVFLLGVYAGRGLGGRQLAGDDQLVRLPVAPATSEEPRTLDEPTIDDAVTTGGWLAAHPAERAGPGAPGEAPAGQSAAQRPAAEHAQPRVPAAIAGDRPGAEPEREHAGASGVGPAPAPPQPQARVAVAIEKPDPAPPSSSRSGSWSVQVTASRDPRTADGMLRRLRAKGYDAYVIRVRRQGQTFYRVRVGRYESMERATQMVARLRREPGVPEAFVASD